MSKIRWMFRGFGWVGTGAALGAVLGVGCGAEPSGDAEPPVASASEAVTTTNGVVVSGGVHACAIVQGGAVKCWGNNSDGELGLGDTVNRGTVPSQMGDSLPSVYLGPGRSAKALALGSNHTCALLDNNQVKCWGANGSGQLGRDNTTSVGGSPSDMQNLQPVNLGSGRTAKFIAAAAAQTCAILDNNQLKCWGSNNYGQLGLSAGNLPANGGKLTVGTTTGNMANLAAINLGTGRTAKAITLGAGHTCAILDTNQIKCWGDNESGSLGLGTNGGANVHGTDVGNDPNELGDALPTVNLGSGRSAKAIAAGTSHTCALLDNNQVKCWGTNFSGSLGVNISSGTSIGGHSTDMGDNLRQVILPAGRSALAITAGGNSSCALLDTHQIECWGSNSSGQLGTGNASERGTSTNPMDGTLVSLGTNQTALTVSMGQNTTCASLYGWVKCWGGNTWGQLGLGDTRSRGTSPSDMGDALPSVDLGSRPSWQVAVGYDSVCVGLFAHTGSPNSQDSLKCWGDNSLGNLGSGDTVAHGSGPGQMGAALPEVDLGTDDNGLPYTLNAVYSGGYHSCAVLSSFPFVSSQLKCWGYNGDGELGLGDANNRGDNPDEMGDSLAFVNVGTNRTVAAIAEGQFSTCALLDNNQVKCWGANYSGQLGLGDMNSRGDNPGEMGDALPFVNLGTGRTVKKLSAGSNHVCAILDTNQVKCWGNNGSGQLGLGDTNTRGDNANEMGDTLPLVSLGTGRTAKAIAAGFSHTCAILDTNQVKCWGDNSSGQLGLGDTNARGDNPNEMGTNLPVVNLGTGRTAKAIVAASYHTCALLDNNQVKCWGYNGDGELGLGDTNTRGDNPNEMASLPTLNFGLGRTAVALSAGHGNHTCALLDNNQVKCWGQNVFGELGLGDTNNRGDNPNEMGDSLRVIDTGPDRPMSASAIAISGGSDHACAALADGTASCWGDNGPGDLGRGTFDQKQAPAPVVDSNFAALRSVRGIAAGAQTSCALLSNGTVDCWGFLPGGGTSPFATPVAGVTGAVAIAAGGAQTCALLSSGNASCWTTSQAPALVGLSGATAITVGGSWACARISNGTVQCWGSEDAGQFGDGPPGVGTRATPSAATAVPGLTDAVAISASGNGHHVCAVRATGGVVCWGRNDAGEIGSGSSAVGQVLGPTPVLGLSGAVGVVAGTTQHSCAVLSNGTVQCWGANSNGQLGNGTTTALLSPNANAAVAGITSAKSVSAGENFSCAVLADGRAFCWGKDADAMLGDGSGQLPDQLMPVQVRF